MTAPFAAVAWDVDGTLVDSEPLHHRALLAASAAAGVDLSDLPDMAFRGIHVGDVWEMLAPRLSGAIGREAWFAAIRDHYVSHRRELVAVPGAVETVRRLAEAGVPQVCVSNSERAIVAANLDALGIARLIRFSVTLDDVAAGKPDPEPYARAVRRLTLPPAAVVAVEDSATGAASARAAGLHVVACGPDADAIADAHRVVADLRDLADLFVRADVVVRGPVATA
ncbi:HAD family hydrolase [Oharaeibacter diazotrophicus]|uniref:HAD superfamily hydrolase (TIGR01509 family) n=1 Tax=Oharaeibacter diazotrophicus TaxID=1920512 RepID=A0A4V3CWF9_9HYPH|nr:HAD family phosphatase [Oharaeibacter diazotrophicus]TDP86168.1 HAD superfamily hydrolase (TIGR01509 family) [Oharaeibacter diazotrophicus]BBE71891.1 phosphorylated carbohydrates phosphatase [Pleomorphomonas sp. SM30]GLS78656.1 haloacid dehalogenase [Oharaeibacter diazotrophicus]